MSLLLAKEKNTYRSAYVVPRREFYSFNVRAAIDREDRGVDYEIPETKPSTRLILYLSLAGFVCGFSLLNHRWPMRGTMTKTVQALVAIKVVLRRKDA